MFRFILFAAAFFFVISCRSSNVIQPQKHDKTPAYSLIYIIHGDANYLYHNANGYPLQADEQVLKEARKVGKQAMSGEVFIFHQRPEKKILWLFPQKDRRLLYYRNGQLITDEHYSPQSDEQSFVTETNLYKQYHSTAHTASHKKILLYFGHEIPENEHSYHLSRPKATFGRKMFVEGAGSFLESSEQRFDLTVLSTCDNGTPTMIHALSPIAQNILASPQNLHLSHIDTGRLSALLENPENTTKQIADSLAIKTYERLSSFLQTVVTLTTYNISVMNSSLPALSTAYKEYLNRHPTPAFNVDNIDCAELPFFDSTLYQKGTTTWYQAPRFGHKKSSASHSGWGCKKGTQNIP